MTPLSPSYKKVLRVRGFLAAALLILVPGAIGLNLLREHPLLQGAVAAIVLAGGFLLAAVTPGRRYRAWRYRATQDELHVQSGIWLRSHIVVPFGRVQHIDVSQGPLERRFGVGTLTLHTAGTRNAAVPLPGLEIADAERMRDEIRSQIRQDLT